MLKIIETVIKLAKVTKERKKGYNELIVKSNTLNEASFKLSSLEYKFILFVASKIKKDDEDFQTIKIPIKEFMNAIGVRGNNYHSEIEKISTEIMKKPIKFIDETGFEIANWFSYIRYRKNEGIIEVRFDKVLKPFFLKLEGNFIQYTFQQISQLKSTYSIRLFELLKQYAPIGERTFDIDYLRLLIGADDIYPLYANFKQRVILRAIKEIHEKTDLSFDFEEIKEGRKVVKLLFKNIKFELKHLDAEVVIDKNKPFEERMNSIFNPYGIYFKEEHFKRLKQYDEQMIANAVVQLKNRLERNDHIISPISYLFGILEKMKNAKEVDVVETLETKSLEQDSSRFDRSYLIAEIMEEYKYATSVIPSFMLEDTAKEIFSKLGIPPSEHKQLWEDIEGDVKKSFSNILKKNRMLNRRM